MGKERLYDTLKKLKEHGVSFIHQEMNTLAFQMTVVETLWQRSERIKWLV